MSGLENLTVLLVEDSQQLRALLVSVLSQLGVGNIVRANDGADAIRQIKAMQTDPGSIGATSIDLVLTGSWNQLTVPHCCAGFAVTRIPRIASCPSSWSAPIPTGTGFRLPVTWASTSFWRNRFRLLRYSSISMPLSRTPGPSCEPTVFSVRIGGAIENMCRTRNASFILPARIQWRSASGSTPLRAHCAGRSAPT